MRTSAQTARERDMIKLVVAFRNFANAPKNDTLHTKIKVKSYVEFQTAF